MKLLISLMASKRIFDLQGAVSIAEMFSFFHNRTFLTSVPVGTTLATRRRPLSACRTTGGVAGFSYT